MFEQTHLFGVYIVQFSVHGNGWACRSNIALLEINLINFLTMAPFVASLFSISFAYWYTTLLPSGYLHISLTFFNLSPPCHLLIQFCDY